MRVRDLEIALVLAREMKAAAARSVDASLSLEQLQEVFGAAQLDQGERTRIQTALQMAGLEPRPSLLEAQPGTAIGFGLGAAAPPPEAAPAETAAAAEQAPQEFPTVGEFFRRARRRFGTERRAVNGNGNGSHSPAVATAEALEEEHLATDPDYPAGPATPGFGGPPADPGFDAAPEDPLDFDVPPPLDDEDEPALEEEPHVEAELLDEQFAAEAEPEFEVEPEPEFEPELEHEPEDDHYGEVEPEAEVEPEPEIGIPAAAPEPAAGPVAGGLGVEEVAALLLPAVAIPVVATSIGGWRFGLPFVALSVIGTGYLLRRSPRGPVALVRGSRTARTILKATVLVTLASAALAVLLASFGRDNATVSQPRPSATKRVAPAPRAKPPAAKSTNQTPARPVAKRPAANTAHARKPPAGQSDNSTAGLVLVPLKPKSGTSQQPSQGQGPSGQGSSGQQGTTTTPRR